MQPVSGFQYKRLQAPGTTLIADCPIVFHSGIKLAVLAGTVDVYDSNTAAGTASTNLVASIGTATTMQAGAASPVIFDIQMRNGMVAVYTGTLDYLITYA